MMPERHLSDPFELSPPQEYLWETNRFKSLGKPMLSRENPFIALLVSGPFDVGRFSAALESMVTRHEMLRATLTDLGPRPQQRVAASIRLPLSYVDLTAGVPASKRTQATESLIAMVRAGTFDLLSGPLWECLVVRIDGVTHALAFAFSHLVIDGLTLQAFLSQLGALYEGRQLPSLFAQYREHIAEARRMLEPTAEKLDHWRSSLGVVPHRVPFPADRPASSVMRLMRDEQFESRLPSRAVKETCRRLGVTPYLLNMMAYAAVVAMSANYEDQPIVCGSSSVTDVAAELDEQAVGVYMNCIFIALRVNGVDTVGDFARHARQSFHAAQTNLVSYADMLEAVYPDFSRDQPFPGMCVYDLWVRGRIFDVPGDGAGELMSFGAAKATLYPTETRSGYLEFSHPRQAESYARFHVPLLYLNSVDGSKGHLRYDVNQFSPRSVARLAAQLHAMVGAMENPEAKLAEAWADAQRTIHG